MKLVALAIATLVLSGCIQTPSDVAAPAPSPAASPAPSPAARPSASAVPSPSIVAAPRCVYRYSPGGYQMPDLSCTPGEPDPTITQDNIQSTICISGWVDANRPRPSPSTATNLELQGLVDYGVATSLAQARTLISRNELDHSEAREIGGLSAAHIGPNGMPTNLWPEESPTLPNKKDSVENRARRAVCAVPPRLLLADAQRMMADDWPALGHMLGVSGL
jgi:hypothetical protein